MGLLYLCVASDDVALHSPGAHNVLISQWSLDDRVAMDFVRDFYFSWYWNLQCHPIEALRRAKLVWISSKNSRCSDSKNWAPYVLIESRWLWVIFLCCWFGDCPRQSHQVVRLNPSLMVNSSCYRDIVTQRQWIFCYEFIVQILHFGRGFHRMLWLYCFSKWLRFSMSHWISH